MGGRFNKCFCPDPPLHRWRKIWTARPFGGFYRPFDVELWTANLADVFGGPSGTDVVGKVSTLDFLYFDYPNNRFTGPILWQGTRYLGIKIHFTESFDDGVTSWSWERWEYTLFDVNTLDILTAACGGTYDELDDLRATNTSGDGYLVSYTETCSETSWSYTSARENTTIGAAWSLIEEVTYAEQVARCEAHLDFIVSGMTDAELVGSMNIDGQNWPWSNFPDNPGGSVVLGASRLRVHPVTGTLTCEDGVHTYTEWTPDSTHTFEENTTIDGGAQIVIKGAGGWSENGLPVRSSFATYPVEEGHFVFSGLTDDVKAVAQYICQSFTYAYNCTAMGVDWLGVDSFVVEVNQTGDAQPTWGDEGCASTVVGTAHDLPPGHYLITTSGITKKFPASLSPAFAVPSTPFFNIQLYFDSCCPP